MRWVIDIFEDFREWQPGVWFDKQLLTFVPQHALKEFLRAVRPLSPELHERVHSSLFAGIKHPFHPGLATGWMARLSGEPIRGSLDQRESYMRKKLEWSLSDVILLIYNQPTTY